MTEEEYEDRRAAIMRRVYQHENKLANGKPKFPMCLKADLRDLQQLEKEWRESNAGL